MTPVIAASSAKVYRQPSMALLFRLLALAALFLMPFGMSTPAAAAHHKSGSQSHCDGSSQPDQGSTMPQVHCAAACTALPDQPLTPTVARFSRALPPAIPAMYGMIGEQPETATPPPKLS